MLVIIFWVYWTVGMILTALGCNQVEKESGVFVDIGTPSGIFNFLLTSLIAVPTFIYGMVLGAIELIKERKI